MQNFRALGGPQTPKAAPPPLRISGYAPERNALTKAGFTTIWRSTSPGPCAQILRLFMVFTYIWQKHVAKISKVPKAQRDVNPARQ